MEVHKIARLLPTVFQRTLTLEDPDADNLLSVILRLMEALHAPTEVALADLDTYFDPYSTPDEFVFYLASWLDLAPLFVEPRQEKYHFSPGIGRLRELIVTAAELANRRGTHGGLQKYLETATGMEGFTITEDQSTPFHIIVSYPAAAKKHFHILERIIELEKPVYVTYELRIQSESNQENSQDDQERGSDE